MTLRDLITKLESLGPDAMGLTVYVKDWNEDYRQPLAKFDVNVEDVYLHEEPEHVVNKRTVPIRGVLIG